MRALLIGLLGFFAASVAHADGVKICGRVPGAEQLWAKPHLRFIVVGEYHGTAETPAFFADLVCLAAATERPVEVALEWEASEQDAIDRFMAGADAAYAPGPLMHDGRHSQAMYALLARLRALKQAGLPIGVSATRHFAPRGYSQSLGEAETAAAWRARALAEPRALVLALTGNLHALTDPRARELNFVPAAAMLPPESVVALQGVRTGGNIWACIGERPDGRPDCGPKPSPSAPGVPVPRGVHLKREPGMQGRYSVGRPFTPSPPGGD